MRRWRHRPFQAAAVVALAALLTACAALAPLYYRAMQQSLTPSVLTHAPIHTSSLYLLADVPSSISMCSHCPECHSSGPRMGR